MANLPEIPNTKGAAWVGLSVGRTPKFIVGQDARGRAGAPSGGGVSAEPLYSFGEPVDMRVTSNPGAVSSQIAASAGVVSEVRKLAKRPQNKLSIYVANDCSPANPGKFKIMRIFAKAIPSSLSQSNDILDGVTGEEADQMDQLDFDALTMIEARQVSHSDQSGTVSTGAINHVIALIDQTCNPAGKLEFLAVGDPVSPATIPRIFYGTRPADAATTDTITWVQQTITAVANGAAEAVAVVGNRVIVACSGTNAGVFTASLDDVKAGTATFTLANGITATHVYNDVIALDGMTVLAVGASGRIALSVDAGFSFTLLTSPTSNDLNRAACGGDKAVVWVGGASGTILRIKNLSTVETITVAGVSTDAVKAVAVPRNRTDEVYVGTAAGEIHRSLDARASTPVWAELNYDKPSGGGLIEDIQFGDAIGHVMFVVQSNGSSQSRVLRDLSGGSAGAWLAPVDLGSFTSPANAVINSIAVVDANFAVTVGEPETAQGFIGIVAG